MNPIRAATGTYIDSVAQLSLADEMNIGYLAKGWEGAQRHRAFTLAGLRPCRIKEQLVSRTRLSRVSDDIAQFRSEAR